MSSRRAALAAVAFALALAPMAGLAHHGWSNFDDKKPMTLTGSITESRWENPHATIKVTAGPDTWTVDLAPIFRMEGRGLTADAIKVGTAAEVMGYPHREIKGLLRAEWIKVAGKTVQLR